MSQAKNISTYDLTNISGSFSLEQLCSKQQKLIEMLHKQVETLKSVILDMEKDIQSYERTVRQLAKEYHVEFVDISRLDDFLCTIKKSIDSVISQKAKLPQPTIQVREVLKEVPIFVEKQIQIIKEVEKPIFVEKIREIQKPVFVQKIIELPCSKCQLAAHQRIKT